MNRIERRVAGAGGPRPGAAVCEPGQPANNQRRGMLGGGLLSSRMNSRNSTSRMYNRNTISNSNDIPGLRNLKNQDNKITRLEKKMEQIEESYALNLSEMERKLRIQENKISLVTDTYQKTMKQMQQYITELKNKINELEKPKVKVPAENIRKIEEIVENKITLEIQEKDE